ncbi:MAG: hypothetical protein KF832_00360 [Caldilineaceae bacterium]|nr:hypothetical protein [Caldilineaceae bacterium]
MRNYAPFRQSALTYIAVGAVLGLVLGLLIGWVFWPVEWEGATLRDLDTPEKAEYVAAVADAFVIYDNPEAAIVAQRRLAALDDGNLTQTINATLQYFSQSPFSDKAIRDSNIRRLAVALNLSPTSPALAPAVLAANSPEAIATPTLAPLITATPASETSGQLGWLGWLLWLLTALVLVAGGIYLLGRAGLSDLQALFKPRTATSPAPADEIDEFDEPPSRQKRSTVHVLPHADKTAEDYSFEQEDEWSTYRPSANITSQSTSPASHDPYRRPAANNYRDADDPDDDFLDEAYNDDDDRDDYEAYDEEGFANEEEQEQPWRATGRSYSIDVEQENLARQRDLPPTPPAALPSSDDSDLGTGGRWADRSHPDPGDESRPSAAWAPTVAASPPPTPRQPSAIRSRAKVIDQHSFQYRMGIADYDESRPIVDPQTNKYIGEFGMGIGSRNGLTPNAPEQVIALEVWLFDKSDERNLGQQTRILLSEYAVDHNLEQSFLRERQDNPRPFTAQPGIHFQLESQNLLLDCTIISVEYSTANATKGVFQEIKVDMTVQKK